jgi:hypothetical protein
LRCFERFELLRVACTRIVVCVLFDTLICQFPQGHLVNFCSNVINENLEVIQTWFNSGSGMEAGVSQLRHVGLVSIVRHGD